MHQHADPRLAARAPAHGAHGPAAHAQDGAGVSPFGLAQNGGAAASRCVPSASASSEELEAGARYATTSLTPLGAGPSSYASSFSPKPGSRVPVVEHVGLAKSWVPDALAMACYKCEKEFSFIGWRGTRRHHCRCCGNCFCSACSSNNIQLVQGDKAVRVCDFCYDNILQLMHAPAAVQRLASEHSESSQSMPAGHLSAEEYDGDEEETAVDESASEASERAGLETRSGGGSSAGAGGGSGSGSAGGGGGGGAGGFSPPSTRVASDATSARGALAMLAGRPLMPRESAVRVFDNVHFEYTHGQVLVTTFRVVLSERNSAGSDRGAARRAVVSVPLLSIERIEISLAEEYEAGVIDIFCKNFRFVRLAMFGMVSQQRFMEFHELEHSLVNLAFPARNTRFWKRFGSVLWPAPGGKVDELSACCPDLHCQDRPEMDRLIAGNPNWRVSAANTKFLLCGSYPRLLMVPAAVTDRELFEIADFRSRRRIPALSWVDRDSALAIVRCSQPKVGLLRGRSHVDERFVAAVALAGRSGLVILDARPAVNATVNKVTVNGGFEDIASYNETLRTAAKRRGERVPGQVTLEFMDVQNTNTVRASVCKVKKLIGYKLKKAPRYPAAAAWATSRTSSSRNLLQNASEGDDNGFEIKWLSKFVESRWLELLGYIIKAAVRVVRIIKTQRKSVLVHCSDGWDRTAQIVSLAMLLMDPHYRTLEGFLLLIEKEWLAFGHPFRKRTGTGDSAETNSAKDVFKLPSAHISSIFLQFIESVWQISHQFPTAFQFNQVLLVLVLDRLYDGRHKTFLVNSRKETAEYQLDASGTCLWEEVLAHRSRFLNPLFAPTSEILFPAFSTKTLQFWQGYYLRFDESCVAPEEVEQMETNSSSKPSSLSRRNPRRFHRTDSSQLCVVLGPSPTEICAGVVDDLVADAVIISLGNQLDRLVAAAAADADAAAE